MSNATIIPFELPLPQVLPTIEGNVDYRQFRDQLLRIDELLRHSGLETQLLEADLRGWLGRRKRVSAKAQQNRQLHSRRALRCNIARLLLKEDYRGFAARAADSPLLQFFVGIGEVDRVRVPSKSTLQRYDLWWKEAEVRPLVHQLLCLGAEAPRQLQLTQPLDLESAFLDTTCLVGPASAGDPPRSFGFPGRSEPAGCRCAAVGRESRDNRHCPRWWAGCGAVAVRTESCWQRP